MHQVVTEVEDEGDEGGGGDDGEDEEGDDVVWPDWLSLDCWTQLVTQITLAAPDINPQSVFLFWSCLEDT